MTSTKLAAALASVVALAATNAQAATIAGLFNTGVDDSGVALAGGDGVVDTHWTILSSTSPGFDGQQAVTYKHPSYLADDADSRWVSLSGTGSPGSNTTIYRLTFDLTGLDFSTAQISGAFSGDNTTDLLLNGVATGFSTGNFGTLMAFSLNSGFVAGVNTFDVRVQDFGAPTAFRVDNLAGTVDVGGSAPVPEPATWAMMLLGFFGMGTLVRGRRRAVTA